jgi:hypothetical protein
VDPLKSYELRVSRYENDERGECGLALRLATMDFSVGDQPPFNDNTVDGD